MELLLNNIFFSAKLQLTLCIVILSVLAFLIGYIFPTIIKFYLNFVAYSEVAITTEKLLQPYRKLIGIAFGLGFLEIVALFIPFLDEYPAIEIIISLILTIEACWLFSRIFEKYINDYILESALKSGRQANSELLILGKVTAYFAIIFGGIVFFTKTHKINIFS